MPRLIVQTGDHCLVPVLRISRLHIQIEYRWGLRQYLDHSVQALHLISGSNVRQIDVKIPEWHGALTRIAQIIVDGTTLDASPGKAYRANCQFTLCLQIVDIAFRSTDKIDRSRTLLFHK